MNIKGFFLRIKNFATYASWFQWTSYSQSVQGIDHPIKLHVQIPFRTTVGNQVICLNPLQK